MEQYRVKYVAIALLALIFGCLTGCGGFTGHAIDGPGIDDPIMIGVLASLSGGAANWGQNELNGALLAVEEANRAGGINGRSILLQAEDIGTVDKKRTISAYNFLHDIHDIDIILGPTWVESMEAIAPIAAEDHALLIGVSSGSKSDTHLLDNGYVISLWPSDRFETDFEAAFMADHGIKRVAVIYNQEAYPELMKNNFLASANDMRITNVHVERFDSTDFRDALLASRDADAIYVALGDPGGYAELLLRQRKELGVDTPIYLNMFETGDDFLDRNTYLFENVFFPSPKKTTAFEQFEQRYQARFGEPPSTPSTSIAYDAMKLVVEAMKTGAESPEDVRDALLRTRNYPGATTTITMTQQGDISGRDFIMLTIENGQFTEVH